MRRRRTKRGSKIRAVAILIFMWVAVFAVKGLEMIIQKANEGKNAVQAQEAESEKKGEAAEEKYTTEVYISEAFSEPSKEPPKFQDMHSMDWDAEESYLLAKMAMAEAEGESTEGKAMAILVILNRVWDERFPGTIEDVIFEEHRGTYQFSPVAPGGRWWRVEPDADCYKALDLIMLNRWDESEGALYFEATYNGENTWHSNNLEFIKTVGNHNFYK